MTPGAGGGAASGGAAGCSAGACAVLGGGGACGAWACAAGPIASKERPSAEAATHAREARARRAAGVARRSSGSGNVGIEDCPFGRGSVRGESRSRRLRSLLR
ncbi:hypothetical protein E8A74_29300 [Polyangium fumosum]|uniref:Uncharacterized protein n=1 Tax=Polyangium fumosum TaxID=889272 RepID=A0A4U1J4U8_9BACT|nr:hypothetical protein E8A74_29300 [Polyangium fumosum]